MTRPTRNTTSGRSYLDLRARARREGRTTDELLVLYVLERLLCRLSISPHRSRLILKGGMLLSAFDQRRPTRDVDLLARATSNEIAPVTELVSEIATIDVDDGVRYDPTRMTAQTIRQQDVYTAVRIVMPARVDRAQYPLRVDVNVGDPVTPAPVELTYPALLGEAFTIVGYPMETVLAEKLVTMITRGDTTTRDRDFANVLLLIGRYTIDAAQLAGAVTATAAHRQIEPRPLAEILFTLGRDRQADWRRFLMRAGLQQDLPSSYQDAIWQISGFADPILDGSVATGWWEHQHARWAT